MAIFYRKPNSRYLREEDKCPICECRLVRLRRFAHVAQCADMAATEHAQQVAGFEWLKTVYNKFPVLKLTHAIPNEGKRTIGAAYRLIRQGLKSGVPDTDLPIGRRGFHSLRPEFKVRGKYPTENQVVWLDALWAEDNYTLVVFHWTEFRDAVLWYIGETDVAPARWPDQKVELLKTKPKRAKKPRTTTATKVTAKEAARLLRSGKAQVATSTTRGLRDLK